MEENQLIYQVQLDHIINLIQMLQKFKKRNGFNLCKTIMCLIIKSLEIIINIRKIILKLITIYQKFYNQYQNIILIIYFQLLKHLMLGLLVEITQKVENLIQQMIHIQIIIYHLNGIRQKYIFRWIIKNIIILLGEHYLDYQFV